MKNQPSRVVRCESVDVITDEVMLHTWISITPGPKLFEVHRGHDESGLSGTGKVIEGIEFSDGSVAIHWCSPLWSVTFFPSWDMFYAVHTGGHPTNQTIIRFPHHKVEYWQDAA